MCPNRGVVKAVVKAHPPPPCSKPAVMPRAMARKASRKTVGAKPPKVKERAKAPPLAAPNDRKCPKYQCTQCLKVLRPRDDYWCDECCGKHGEDSVSRTFLKKERKMLYAVEAFEGAVAVLAPSLPPGSEELIQRLGVELLGRPKDSLTTLEYAMRKARSMVAEDERFKMIGPDSLAKVVVQALGDTRADTIVTEFLSRPEVLKGLRSSGDLFREGSLEKRFSLFKRGYAPTVKDLIPLFRAQTLHRK